MAGINNFYREKKGVLFSTDALIAISIILITIIVLVPIVKYSQTQSEVPEDILTVFSEITIGDLDSSYAAQLISDGKVEDTNKSVLEQIGEFYVTNITLAKELAEAALESLDTEQNIGIWFENEMIYSKNSTPLENAKNVDTERIIISGLREGESVTGFSARVYLQNNYRVKYFYFGGYVGNGNLSVFLNYSGNIQNANLEIATNEDFDVYINDVFSGHYQNSSSDFVPANYDLGAYISNFNSGSNIVKLVGSDEVFHVAGGYMKIGIYNSSIYEDDDKKYYIPGIDGLINIYDGFYVPGILEGMEVSLHMDTPYTTFLTVGNTTLFRDSTSGEETITISNSTIAELLDYSDFSNKTIPLRLGMENASYVINSSKKADVISVTDLSGSMDDDLSCSGADSSCCEECFWIWCWDECQNDADRCLACGGNVSGKIIAAKEANKVFIDEVLNFSGNRVGLVGYQTSVLESDTHPLSDDNVSLKAKVDEWEAGGNTCICCGINEAVDKLLENSSSENYQSIVVMSDGLANRQCSEQGTGSATDDAIQAACDAYNNYGIVVHAVGFGGDVDETTLEDIASCGNGEYYYGDVSNLAELYEVIAEEILKAAYIEQTIVSTGINVKLYPDSYIKLSYKDITIPYGLLLTLEEMFDNSSAGHFDIPDNSTIVDATTISYSGSRWTSKVFLNGNPFYDLSNYGSSYIELGDPYSIRLPPEYIDQNNTVEVYTSLSPSNLTVGSSFNKIIYRVIKEFVSYSPVTSYSSGCRWTIDLEDGSNITMVVPSNYTGTAECNYQESGLVYNSNDAIQAATYDILSKLDFDSDLKVDAEFSSGDLEITTSEIEGIPYDWYTEVQVRRWY